MIPTPSQTIGPFLHLAVPRDTRGEALPANDPRALLLAGRLLDGEGQAVSDGLVEIWDGARGARCPTDEDGWFHFVIDGARGPLAVWVFARGLLSGLVTRCYLPGTSDDVLTNLPPERADTLRAEPAGDGAGLRFDIHLQGERETVFFAA